VREERFDLALTRLPVEDQGLMQRGLHEEQLMLALPEGHPLAGCDEIALADVRAEGFVMCRRHERAPLQHIILQRCEAAGFRPRVIQEVEGKTLMMELVAAGVGLTLVPESSARARRVGLVYRKIVDELAPIRMAAIWRRENGNPLRKIFLAVAVDVARTLGAELPASRARAAQRKIAAGE